MNWADERHALYVGAVCGLAIYHGLDIVGDVDDQGDWTDRIVIRFSDEVYVTVIVPPPPDDWTLDSWKPGHRDRDDPSYCETCGGPCRDP
jgi:hypothetical protein